VNRTENNPLEVQLLSDVALPLIHDSVLAWETIAPDIVQRMLLAGMAVSSPLDAAALHPGLFASANQAKLAFARAGFKGQNPIDIAYRGMTLKSAAYLRGGRGRSWQQVWWMHGDEADVRVQLERAIRGLEGWKVS
jgi:hypothetical protein